MLYVTEQHFPLSGQGEGGNQGLLPGIASFKADRIGGKISTRR